MAIDEAPKPRRPDDHLLAQDLRALNETSTKRRTVAPRSPEWTRLVREEREIAERFLTRIKRPR